jgi:hypothetical protein
MPRKPPVKAVCPNEDEAAIIKQNAEQIKNFGAVNRPQLKTLK